MEMTERILGWHDSDMGEEQRMMLNKIGSAEHAQAQAQAQAQGEERKNKY